MKHVTHERAICHDPQQFVKLRLAHKQSVGLQTHLLSKHCVHKKCLFLGFLTKVTCLSVVLLSICQVLCAPYTIVCLRVMTNCCFMSDVLYSTTDFFFYY